ncbi:hypothetical protein Angca_006920, partial [Angiostrongylus cantonensis]
MRGGVFQRTRRRVRRTLLLPVLLSVAALFAVIAVSTDFLPDSSHHRHHHRHVRRAVRSTSSADEECTRRKNVPNASSEQFPPDLFTLEQRQHGAILLHLGGLVYMFVALAIVCDEFFVPSLSVLIEMFKISEDVAGATFMAAGGSAPEFFTSVFGVFVAQNNVGIGTIVGSATFNILCVLAFCTLFSREVLHLTWWPLFRDVLFYIIALLFLVIFFADEKITWHEALTMFLIYIIYGIFMKYNSQIEMSVKRFLQRKDETEPVGVKIPNVGCDRRRSIPMIHGGNQIRNGIAHMAIGSDDENGQIVVEALLKLPNLNNFTFLRKHTVCFYSSRSKTNDFHSEPLRKGISEAVSLDKSAFLSCSVIKKRDDEHKNMAATEKRSFLKLFMPLVFHIYCADRSTSPIRIISMLNAEQEEPLDLSWPETPLKRFIFVLLAPITFPLSFTLPDVRNPARRSLFAFTFIGSVLWIALFSYLMVWWANTIGETFTVSTEIMGLTILAAGTSIPDLITRYTLRKK